MNVVPLTPPPVPETSAPADPATVAIDEILTMIEDAQNLYRRLLSARIPKAADPVTHFRELRRFWRRLGIEKPTRSAADHRARMLIAQIDGVKNSTEGAAQLLFDRALVTMEQLLSDGVNDPDNPVLSRRDFTASGGLLTLESGALLAGRVDVLPADHFARTWVAQEDLYSLGCPQCLILSDAPKEKEAFFEKNRVIGLTRMWKSAQRRPEADSAKVEQEKMAIRTREWEENQKIQVKVLQAKVAALEAEKARQEALAAASPA